MTWLGSSIVGLLLLVPASAQAQSVKMADLVGMWVRTWSGPADSTFYYTFVMKADTTARHFPSKTTKDASNSEYVGPEAKSIKEWFAYTRYTVSGDTLWIAERKDGGIGTYTMALKDGQLIWTGIEGGGSGGLKFVFKRLDAAKPKR